MKKRNLLFILLMGIIAISCENKDAYIWKPIEVTVTAYNSVEWQTSGNPNVAAWGDTLQSGMKCIAVSRDLIQMGLDRDTQVKIEGLKGIYLVKDKMHQQWTNHIDLYMGEDVEKAQEWGRQKLTIHYAVLKDGIVPENKEDIK